MIEFQLLLIGVAGAMVPVGIVAYMWAVSRIRKVEPEILDQINPRGFRAIHGPSQLKFTRYVLLRRYRSSYRADVVAMCELNFWLIVSYFAVLVGLVATLL